MKKLYLLFILLFTCPVLAQLEYQGEVTTTSDEGEKKNILFAATNKAVEKFSPDLGFDYTDFKKKLDEKFAQYFVEYKELKLTEKYGKGKDSLEKEVKDSFLKSLDADKMSEYQKFSRLLDTVQSYHMKSTSTPTKSLIDIKLDRLKLVRILKRISTGEKKTYSKLWIIQDTRAENFAWSDLGFEKETTFTHPLSESWQKWINENLPDPIEDVGICSGVCSTFFQNWEQQSVDELQSHPVNDYKRGLWAKVSINLRRTHYNPSLTESTFEWSGKLLILDIDTKRIVHSFDLPLERKEWRGIEQKALNSALASRIYRTPLPFFKELDTFLKSAHALNRVSRLVIKGHKNMGDVLALIETLNARGAALGLEIKLDKMSSGEAEAICFYQGEEKSFTDLLSKVKELKSSTSYQVVDEFNGSIHVLKLVSE
jgi:hypothetical protein